MTRRNSSNGTRPATGSPEFWSDALKRVRGSKTLEELRQVVDGVVSELKTELMEREKARCEK